MNDLSVLKELGEVAGVPGIALGIAALVFLAVIAKAAKLKQIYALGIYVLCTVSTSVLAAAGIIASVSGPSTAGKNAPIIEDTGGHVTVEIHDNPARAAPAPPSGRSADDGASPSVGTRGANSPIVTDTKGDVSITIGPKDSE